MYAQEYFESSSFLRVYALQFYKGVDSYLHAGVKFSNFDYRNVIFLNPPGSYFDLFCTALCAIECIMFNVLQTSSLPAPMTSLRFMD